MEKEVEITISKTETRKFSSLTEDEKAIYSAGHDEGARFGSMVVGGFVVVVIIGLLVIHIIFNGLS